MNKDNKIEQLINNILIKIGGKNNVKDVYHCATRMRITLIDNSIVNLIQLKEIDGVQGALWSSGELQVIIGPKVSKVTAMFKEKVSHKLTDFKTINIIEQKNVNYSKRVIKAISAIFGPLLPFLIGVGLIMALQQILIRTNIAHDPTKDGYVLGRDYNIFDEILNVIATTGFKMMGVIAIWSTVRYLGGKQEIAIALGLLMISPILIPDGVKLLTIESWDIMIKPFYSTILAFIAMGILLAYGQKLMEKYFNPVANFILNPFLSLFIGGILAFFIIGPLMNIAENGMLNLFNKFMTLPFGIGELIVGLTWQPLVVLGVHNILFFAAVTDLTTTLHKSLFLAAAFAAAWAQMGASIAVGLKSKRWVDKSVAFSAALPGIISGPTESCIYGVNLPRFTPFITGTLAGGIGGWSIGIFNVGLNNLAGLGGIVGFLAYNDDLLKAIIIDSISFGLGIAITFIIWSDIKKIDSILNKTIKWATKTEYLNKKTDYKSLEFINVYKDKKIDDISKAEILLLLSEDLNIDTSLEKSILQVIQNIKNGNYNMILFNKVKKELKNHQTQRQTDLNNLYKEIKNTIKETKVINNEINNYRKYSIKKDNLAYRLKKTEPLINNSLNIYSIETLISNDINIKNESKLAKLNLLLKKYHSYDEKISTLKNELNLKTNKWYNIINDKIIKIEKIKNTELPILRNKIYNSVHNFEIEERLVNAK
ncbi:PTS transporter subunit EIIB [Spiroplasma endosymbiont of Aspidapion aeneum]|uniref:PTS transporter subunit EIIB n=1 Tax=Spiroplasma endosymbiont of Aspidapion aeneum TaxID=3066276 RepID=UPI00313CBE35